MSLLKTKPKWCPLAEAAENGWINSKTGELLVSIRGLKSKLEAEMLSLNKATPVITESIAEPVTLKVEIQDAPVVVSAIIQEPVTTTKVEIQDETSNIMNAPEPIVAPPVVVNEQTIKKPKKNQKIIAEVVEYKLNKDKEIIGE